MGRCQVPVPPPSPKRPPWSQPPDAARPRDLWRPAEPGKPRCRGDDLSPAPDDRSSTIAAKIAAEGSARIWLADPAASHLSPKQVSRLQGTNANENRASPR